MLELPPNAPRIEDYLPQWSRKRFVFVEPADRWASAVATEVVQILSKAKDSGIQFPEFESCRTAREAFLLGELRNTVGLVLFLSGMERELVGLSSRLHRLARCPRLLAIGTGVHREIVPVLMESGIDTVLLDVHHDLPVARWCVRVLQSDSSNHASSGNSFRTKRS